MMRDSNADGVRIATLPIHPRQPISPAEELVNGNAVQDLSSAT
jgi:hypothetical protein